MKILIILLIALIAFVQAINIGKLNLGEWNAFKLQHKKNYDNETNDECRAKIYLENKYSIAEHNKKYENQERSFKLGINKYADMLHHEFVNAMNGFNKSSKPNDLEIIKKWRGAKFIVPHHVDLPTTVDWRHDGAVTPVKDQGNCGSCWAFSTTGSLEGQHFRSTGSLVSLSEQNLLDCSRKYGNDGCDGGLMDQAFQYIKENRGIDTEKTYPYEAQDGKCRYVAKNKGAEDVGYVDIPKDEEKLKAAVATIGPISVGIDASQQSFQFYAGGVYDEPECSSDELDHGVLVVGYGTTKDGQDYWLVKNSWGETWGEKGYIKMSRNKKNQCGIASAASYPLV